MATWKYLWWELPAKAEDVAPYLDKKFANAGEHVWMKLLRTALENRMLAAINPKPVGSVDKVTDNKKGA